MIKKRIVCSQRLRRVPAQFSWVDQSLVRNKHIRGRSHGSLALYLFLVTVADADGLSYYADVTIRQYLRLSAARLDKYRSELCHAGLIAYSPPFYQVLSLDAPLQRETKAAQSVPARSHAAESIAHILKMAMGGCND